MYKFCILLLWARLSRATPFAQDNEEFRVIPHTEIYDNIDSEFLDLFSHDRTTGSIDVFTVLKNLLENKNDFNDEELKLKRENKTKLESSLAKPMSFRSGIGIIDVRKRDRIPR